MNMNETLERALRTLPKYKSVDFGDKEDRISVAEIIELLMEKKYPIDGVGFGGYLENIAVVAHEMGKDYVAIPLDTYCEMLRRLKTHNARVMTLEEVQTAEDCNEPVFLEIRDDGSTPDVFSWRIVKHVTPLTDRPIFILDCAGFSSALYSESYGYLWRCWTNRPTDEQRKVVKWNDRC